MNHIMEVAKILGHDDGCSFYVVGEDGGKAKIKIDPTHGIMRHDGTSWNKANYFWEYLITGKVKLIEELEEITLF